jgi:putative phosphoesterase
MKILVLSDSHGEISAMERAVERTRPDAIYHLGDYWRDAVHLRASFPEIPLEQVPGNCDYLSPESSERLLFPSGKRVLICHGHTRHVKESLMEAEYLAQELQLDALLFGHTHRALRYPLGGTLFLNPGSIGDHFHPSYGILTIRGNTVTGKIISL